MQTTDTMFSLLKYPNKLFNSTFPRLIAAKAPDQPVSSPTVTDRTDPIQCLVYKFKCGLCDARYVGFTRCYMHQRIKERRNSTSSSGKHFGNKHSLAPRDPTKNFSVLKKCTNKFDCLFYEMFLYNNWNLLSICSRTRFVQKFSIRC